MQYPVARFPDSLVLSKFETIASELTKRTWTVTVAGEHHQMFVLTLPAGVKRPWETNGVAKAMAEGSSIAGRTFTLVVDDHHIVQFIRQQGSPHDTVSIDQNWFGRDEAGYRAFIESTGIVSKQFGLTGPWTTLPENLSGELGRFVETRDQGLARLEELYTRFTQNVLEERERLSVELQKKVVDLDKETQSKRFQLDEQFAAKVAALDQREAALADRLKQIDDRGAKHARRALRDTIIGELTKRESAFTLTTGTNRLRMPIAGTLIAAGLLFTAGLVHNALTAPEILSKSTTGFDWGLTYFLLKQLTYTAGLISVVWYGIRWNDRWFREHANEEFKSKTMQIDILRANWVVETLLEWNVEQDGQIPPELLERLTHNLFRYPEEAAANTDATGLASVLLGSATEARLNIGGNKLNFSRSGAKELSKKLAE